MKDNRKLRQVAIVTGVGLAASLGLSAGVAPAFAGNGHGPGKGHDRGIDTSQLREAVTAENINEHLEALQEIADENDGNRAAGTSGHVASAEYIEQQLQSVGYKTERQPFSYDQFVLNESALDQVTPTPTSYVDQTDYAVMSYSGAGDVTGTVVPVDLNLEGDRASTSGCEAEDFAGFAAGSVALIQRGTCAFRTKVDNAAAAGAVGAVVFNQGNEVEGDDRFGILFGTLASPRSAQPSRSVKRWLAQRMRLFASRSMPPSALSRPSTCSLTRKAKTSTPSSLVRTLTRLPKAPESTTTPVEAPRYSKPPSRWRSRKTSRETRCDLRSGAVKKTA